MLRSRVNSRRRKPDVCGSCISRTTSVGVARGEIPFALLPRPAPHKYLLSIIGININVTIPNLVR